MKKVCIVIIGDEILLGRVTDTNSGAIARAVDSIGTRVVNITTVADNSKAIREAVDDAMTLADVVFTTGGLGPTKDDVTKNVLWEIFGGEIIRDSNITRNIEKIFEGRGLKLNQLTLDQALVPSSAHIIQNRFGTAPIMVFERNGKLLVSMPGVPYETEEMLPEVVNYLSTKLETGIGIRHESRVVTGLSESALAQQLEDFETELPESYKLAYLPNSPVILLRLDGPSYDKDYDVFLEKLDRTLESISELYILGKEDKSLAQLVVETLKSKNLTMSTAESCTGGNIAHIITGISGSSTIFNGSVVSYANTAKTEVLGVGRETIETNGAVSKPVVIQMVEGVSRIMSTDCAVATSGIAGPGGGTADKPVGTVWIAVKTPKITLAQCYRFPGNRQRVIARASATALIMLLQSL